MLQRWLKSEQTWREIVAALHRDVNDARRNHPVELIGLKLRIGYVTDMSVFRIGG